MPGVIFICLLSLSVDLVHNKPCKVVKHRKLVENVCIDMLNCTTPDSGVRCLGKVFVDAIWGQQG